MLACDPPCFFDNQYKLGRNGAERVGLFVGIRELSLTESHFPATGGYPASRRCCVRKRDWMAARLRSWRALIRATSACLPSGFRGRVSFRISTMSRGVSNSRPGGASTRCSAMYNIASITIVM